MKTLDEQPRATNALASYAVPLEGSLGRANKEPPDATRNPFQRDRDRIIHTQAFRRLQGKTQVFVAGEGDHYRTRLTHTMEVAQISRDIARTFRLNEDLTECVALAHDLGHPPFGHAGEHALDQWARRRGMEFEHNEQSLRIVTVLEEHASSFRGLNLNREVLEGLEKHRTPYDGRDRAGERALSLEAQVVNLADEIAYTGHDSDDGIHAGLFTLSTLRGLRLPDRAAALATPRGTSLRGALIHLLVTDLYEQTKRSLAEARVKTLDDVYATHETLVRFSDAMRADIRELRSFLEKALYLAPSVKAAHNAGEEIVSRLCEAYAANPPEKILLLQRKLTSSLDEAVKDYVAGMTDSFATAQGEQL
jgi:dGTPase